MNICHTYYNLSTCKKICHNIYNFFLFIQFFQFYQNTTEFKIIKVSKFCTSLQNTLRYDNLVFVCKHNNTISVLMFQHLSRHSYVHNTNEKKIKLKT